MSGTLLLKLQINTVSVECVLYYIVQIHEHPLCVISVSLSYTHTH